VQNVSFTPIFAVGSVLHLTSFIIVCWLIGQQGVLQSVEPGPARPAAA
jgi:hypothetical protein